MCKGFFKWKMSVKIIITKNLSIIGFHLLSFIFSYLFLIYYPPMSIFCASLSENVALCDLFFLLSGNIPGLYQLHDMWLGFAGTCLEPPREFEEGRTWRVLHQMEHWVNTIKIEETVSTSLCLVMIFVGFQAVVTSLHQLSSFLHFAI